MKLIIEWDTPEECIEQAGLQADGEKFIVKRGDGGQSQ